MKVTVLGTGTSQGVPMIACDCHVCQSPNTKDKRLRSSIMISANGENYVIDAGPDFRQQMLRANVKSLRGVIFTHEHKDHIAGLDDVRAFNYIENRDMDVYCSENVDVALKREYHYVFSALKYPGVPELNLIRITNNESFTLKNQLTVVPIQVMHYKMEVYGFRIGDFAYITDAKTVANEEVEKLKGVKVLIINALRKQPHISHFNLEEALAFIERIAPEKAFLTHISHIFGTHEEIESELPESISVAYDGMELSI
jgi:phosphoribosyl 1,2-cyclic phosphate phosphodiesterase